MAEYIDKQVAIDVLDKEYRYGADIDRCGLATALDEIETIPAADVVPVVHAHWRDTGSGQECSACKEIQYGYDTGRHYCPHCGAKMDGGDEHG